MLRKTIFMLSLFSLLLITTAGCWDSQDMENRATVLALAIDKVENEPLNDEDDLEIVPFSGDSPKPGKKLIRLTAQVAVPGRIPLGPELGGGGDNNEDPVWVLTSTGYTIKDALLNLQQKLAEELFLGHLRIIILHEDVAKEGVEPFNDFLRREAEVRREAWMVVSKESAGEYMTVAPKLERVPALYLTSMIDNAVELGKLPPGVIGLFWRVINSKGQEGYLPYLQIKNKENIQISGLAYFKGDQMAGVTTPFEIGVFMGIIGEEEGGYGIFTQMPGTEQNVLIESVKRRTQLETVLKDGKPEVHIKVKIEGEIEESAQESVDLNVPETLRAIETQTAEDSEEAARSFIQHMQAEQIDIFGIGERIRAKHPAYWNSEVGNTERWGEIFEHITIHVEAEWTIRRTGMKAT